MQLLENENEFIIHGYAYRDWIREIPNAQQNVGEYGPVGGIDLNRAMDVVYNETRDFLLQVYPALSESDVSPAALRCMRARCNSRPGEAHSAVPCSKPAL